MVPATPSRSTPFWRRAGHFPLHVPIAVLFSLLILAVGGAISLYHFQQTSRLLKQVHQRLFAEVAGRARDSLAHAAMTVSNTFIQLGESPLADASGLPRRLTYLRQLTAILDSDPLMLSVAAGYDGGDFFLLRRVQRVSGAIEIPPEAVWEVHSIEASSRPPIRQLQYFDRALRFLTYGTRPLEGFDPRLTAWYRQAAASDRLIVTAPYRLHASTEQGISFAQRNGGVVLSIDVGLNAISRLLAGISLNPSGKLQLLDENGRVLASSEPTPADGNDATAALSEAWQLFRQGQQEQSVNIGSRPWLVSMAAMPGLSAKSWALGFTAPEDEVFSEAYRQRRMAFLFTLVAVILSIPIAWSLSLILTKPLHRLAGEARTLSALRFDGPDETRSVILEVDQLAGAMSMMQGAIARFLELGHSLGSAREVAAVLREVVAGSREVSRAPWGAVAILPGDGTMVPHVTPETWASDGPDPAAIGPAVMAAFNDLSAIVASGDGPMTLGFSLPTGEAIQLLGIPLRTPQQEILGMLLLADWRHPSCGLARPEVAGFLEALSGTAAIALENQSLLEGRKKLLHAVIRMVADAIDAKSPYTGRHCRRVPELARSLAQAADAATEGPFADFHLDLADWEALDIAAWLHDCGKLTTPEYVLDKATKLETLYNRIHEIRVRFEVLKRDAEVSYWRGLAQGQDEALLRRERDQAWQSLDGDFAFVAHCNLGTEQISAEDKDRLAAIARRTWQRTLDDRLGLSQMELARKQGNAILPATEHLLANHPEHLVERNPGILQDAQKFSMKVPEHLCHLGELHNLSVAHGTLTEEERFKIEEHIIQTITMLANLPFPPDLAAVPEMAGGHHEAMDGSGYPRGLRREQMSVPARIMAIADVFEALTAADRPYKAHLPVAEALAIMARMRDEDKLDGDLFALFLESGVWRDYAARHLPEPTGDMDVRQYLTRKLVRHVS